MTPHPIRPHGPVRRILTASYAISAGLLLLLISTAAPVAATQYTSYPNQTFAATPTTNFPPGTAANSFTDYGQWNTVPYYGLYWNTMNTTAANGGSASLELNGGYYTPAWTAVKRTYQLSQDWDMRVTGWVYAWCYGPSAAATASQSTTLTFNLYDNTANKMVLTTPLTKTLATTTVTCNSSSLAGYATFGPTVWTTTSPVLVPGHSYSAIATIDQVTSALTTGDATAWSCGTLWDGSGPPGTLCIPYNGGAAAVLHYISVS